MVRVVMIRCGGLAYRQRVSFDQQSYCTPGRVSTATGDCLRTGKPS